MKITPFSAHYNKSFCSNPDRRKQLDDYQKQMGLDIKDLNLLNHAFTYNPNSKIYERVDYEKFQKLEFLGDSVFEVCAEEILSEELSNTISKSDLNIKKENTVMNKSLENLCKKAGLDKMVYSSEYPPEGKKYADIFEAFIGAIFVDKGKEGLKYVKKFLKENLKEELLSPISVSKEKDIRIILKNFSDKRKMKLRYTYALAGKGKFFCTAYLDDVNYGSGFGESKKEASQNAAKEAFKKLNLCARYEK